MPPYKSPETGTAFVARLVRVDSTLVVTEPNDVKTRISELIRNEGIFDRVKQRRAEDPSSVDAGEYTVLARGIIDVSGSSSEEGLPETDEARARTIDLFRTLSPNHTVTSS